MIRVLFAMLLVVVLAAAQAGEEQLITVNVDLVNVYFTVCNKRGRLIPNLDRESFAVYEDNSLQVITNFSRETDLPLSIALLIDTSGSVRYKLAFEREAAIGFLNSTLRQGLDRAAVVTFDSTIDLRQDYTNDQQVLANALRRIRSGGGTRLYDALLFLVNGSLAGRDGRRAIILLTDGDDNSSRTSAGEVVEAAQRNNVAIYAISVNSVGFRFDDSDRGDGALEILGTETGGKAFFPKRLKDLHAHFRAISKELRSQYSIAYRSANPKRDGAYRKIRIDVKDAHYFVRARSGYYAPSTWRSE
jgi:Ca-activated chloride channel homolog